MALTHETRVRVPAAERFHINFDGNAKNMTPVSSRHAEIAQLGERQTEDLKVPGSIPGLGITDYAVAGPSNCSRN